MGQYKIFRDQDYNFIRIVHEGKWTLKTSNKLMKLAVEMAEREKLNRVLVDHRKLEINLSIPEIFERGMYAIKIRSHLFFEKTALVQSSSQGKIALDYRFLETILRNRGANVKIFAGDIDAAVDWLNQSAPDS